MRFKDCSGVRLTTHVLKCDLTASRLQLDLPLVQHSSIPIARP